MDTAKRKGPRPRFGAGQQVRVDGGEPVYTIRGIDETEVAIPEYRLADASGEVVLSVAIKDQQLLTRADAEPRQRRPNYRIEKLSMR